MDAFGNVVLVILGISVTLFIVSLLLFVTVALFKMIREL